MADYTGSFSGSFTGSFTGTYVGVSEQVQYSGIQDTPITITPFQRNSIIANNNFRESTFQTFSSSVNTLITDNINELASLSSSYISNSGSISNRVTLNSQSIVDLSSSVASDINDNSNSITSLSNDFQNYSSSLNYSSGSYSGSFEGNASNLTNVDADNTDLQQSITANQTVGGITAGESFSIGTSVESMLRQILIQYIAPEINNISLVNSSTTVLSSNVTRQVGNDITFDNVDIVTVSDDPNLRYPYSASFTASGADSGDFSSYLGDYALGPDSSVVQDSKTERESLGSNTINVTSIPSENSQIVNFYVNGVNPNDSTTITSNSRRITYVYPIYYGMSATDYSSAGDIYMDGGITTLIQTVGDKTLNINGSSAYVYFAYPSRYGALSDIKDGNGFSLSGFLGNRYTRTINGDGWSSVEYYIYRTVTTTTVSSQNYQFQF